MAFDLGPKLKHYSFVKIINLCVFNYLLLLMTFFQFCLYYQKLGNTKSNIYLHLVFRDVVV